MAYVIKRYSNRKLYDTQASRYVTLEELEELIRAGKEISVVDVSTGEDLTSVTLANILAHPAGPTLAVAPVSQAQVSAFGIEYSGQDLSGFANRFNWNG